ncbi:conserved protein of unknown function [Pseudomonas marincola]|uniref:Uncharacterized protein n=1 Tax=Pseudomonas marincola TaxID=437900 RepID=A0A653E9K4_9PSED|nr:conserved protein of unknown function [Pseudomonas marincola]
MLRAIASDIRGLHKHLDHLLNPALICLGEAPHIRAIEIKHADQPPVLDHRHHQLTVGRAVASDVASKGMHIFYPLRKPGSSRSAADAPAERDAHTRHLALERAKHQFLTARQIKASPVEVGYLLKQKRRKLRRIGNKVPLTREQRLQLRHLQGIPGQLITRPW